MEFLERTDESEVATAYLRAELDSPRFRDAVLAGSRGWRIGGLFDGLPEELEWHRVALTPNEVLSTLYAAYALYPEHLPPQLEILLGLSERVDEWSEY